MKKLIALFSILILGQLSWAQVTFHVSSIPSNTPANSSIYLVGNMNEWNPGNADWILNAVAGQGYFLTADIPAGSIQYKFTRGAWSSVEGNANGGFLPDRSSTVNPGDTLDLSILSWEDVGGSNSTALASVTVLSSSFFMPQLNRTRRIWVCLPSDYSTSNSTYYRVVYMHDAQNLFDDALSFSGEWGIDESMRDLMLSGDPGAIIVGIDNSAQRLDEYSPWVNPSYGGGEGEAYVDFIKNTLKPYVDLNYRTLTDASNTAIAGSSMGGIISLYATVKYPQTFAKAGIFSPAYWFARDSLFSWVSSQTIPSNVRIYTVAGTNESSSMISNINGLKTRLLQAGALDSNMLVVNRADGAHSEWFWKREFPAAYQWLFQGSLNGIDSKIIDEIYVKAFPNPANNQVKFDFRGMNKIHFQVIDAKGNIVLQDSLLHGIEYALTTSSYAAGNYILKGYSESGKTFSARITIVKP
jgi:predicted alpha/beta superfamily hydrolase